MDIPINVDVLCAGELCGRSTCLIINPINARITHLVVIENSFPYIERLVPVRTILDFSPNAIQLRCNKTELSGMEHLKETDFISADRLKSPLPYRMPYLVWPYSLYVGMPVPAEHESVPASEVTLRRGMPLKAIDVQIGKVDEFLVDPNNDTLTHLVLREGHLWGKRDVFIPVSEIDRITGDTIYLKLEKEVITTLPTIPTWRNWE